MLSARGGDDGGSEPSMLRRAVVSSRRTKIHSEVLRLLCWKISISGEERRRDVYWR